MKIKFFGVFENHGYIHIYIRIPFCGVFENHGSVAYRYQNHVLLCVLREPRVYIRTRSFCLFEIRGYDIRGEPTWEPDVASRLFRFWYPPNPRWRFPARELWCLSFRVCWVQGFVLLFLWEENSWEVVLFCFVSLFGCCCGAWEWEIFIARYVWRWRWCAGDGTLLLFSLFYSQKLRKV